MYGDSRITKEFVDSIELNDRAYEFYLVGVWKDDEGFYMSTDSGCSCPIPWESHTDDDTTGPLTLEQVAEEATSLWREGGRYVTDGEGDAPILEFIAGLS